MSIVYRALYHVAGLLGVNNVRIRGRRVGELAGPVLRAALAQVCRDRPVPVRGHWMFLHDQGRDVAGWLASGDYEPGTTALFERVLGEGAVVVDAGAHVGYYTLLAARKVGRSGRVYAFEPESRNFGLLVKNVEVNGYDNVIPVKKALSNWSGTAALYLRRSAEHTLYSDGLSDGASQPTDATTLDEFLKAEGSPDVSLVKVDIEGAEPAAVDGMRKLIARSAKLSLIVEFRPAVLERAGTKPEAFIRQLQSMGFTLQLIDDRKGLQPFDVDRALQRLRYADSTVNILCQKQGSRSDSPA